jgi:hypothetical protein
MGPSKVKFYHRGLFQDCVESEVDLAMKYREFVVSSQYRVGKHTVMNILTCKKTSGLSLVAPFFSLSFKSGLTLVAT